MNWLLQCFCGFLLSGVLDSFVLFSFLKKNKRNELNIYKGKKKWKKKGEILLFCKLVEESGSKLTWFWHAVLCGNVGCEANWGLWFLFLLFSSSYNDHFKQVHSNKSHKDTLAILGWMQSMLILALRRNGWKSTNSNWVKHSVIQSTDTKYKFSASHPNLVIASIFETEEPQRTKISILGSTWSIEVTTLPPLSRNLSLLDY